jgi:predicted nuclease of predicted toxin-antitoxin system
MARYLIDVNLPYYFSLWRGAEYAHLKDLNDAWEDSQVWAYAKARDLTIITKDADFSGFALMGQPPPRVIHIRLGNMDMRRFHEALSSRWPEVCSLSRRCKLVQVFLDRLEGID